MSEGARMRVGFVAHPTRDVDRELGALRAWADSHDGEVFQVGGTRDLAERCEVSECGLVLTLGGDGTALSGIRAAAAESRPVLGVACGSLGVLTAVGADALARALERFSSGDWLARAVPALEASADDGESLTALNDIAMLRGGEGQITTAASVDGVLYARLAGDGFVVSTPVGSSAYSFAAGGPLLAPGAEAFSFTPLSSHGGTAPPLVVGAPSTLELEIDHGHGGARLEVDGQALDSAPRSLRVGLRSEKATLVTFDDAEPLLTGLRRRRIVTDSPRVLARDERGEDHASPG